MVDQADRLRRMVKGESQAQPGPALIAVASGKGGVGKTLFAVNFALALCKRGKRVLIIDADFGLSNVDLMLGVNTAFNLAHVIAGKAAFADTIATSHYGLRLIAGGSGAQELLCMDQEQQMQIVERFLRMGDIADTIILDTSAGVHERTLGIIRACDETFVVSTPEPTALLDAYALVKMVSHMQDPPKLNLVINRAENVHEGRSTLQSFEAIVTKYLQTGIKPYGVILQDRAAVQAVKAQEPLLVRTPHAVSSRNIEAIADTYLQQPVSRAPGGLARLIGRLMQTKSGVYLSEG